MNRISGQEMNRFSGQDSPLFDFPVKKQKRFSGQFFGDLGLGFIYLILVALVAMCAAVAGGMLVLAGMGWWVAFNQEPLWTTLITVGTLALYAGCVVAARMGRTK